MMYVVDMWLGREERGVKKFVWWWLKREELLRNDYRKEIVLHIIDTEHGSCCEADTVKFAKRLADWQWGE